MKNTEQGFHHFHPQTLWLVALVGMLNITSGAVFDAAEGFLRRYFALVDLYQEGLANRQVSDRPLHSGQVPDEQGAGLLVVSPTVTTPCQVRFTGPMGVNHSVAVIAESLLEAGILGVSLFRRDPWIDRMTMETQLQIEVLQTGVVHTVTLALLVRWVNSPVQSPLERVKKDRLRAMLIGP
jgi:hypothetical protein